MRYYYVFDRIERKTKFFGNFYEAKEEAERLMKIYLRLNNHVKLKKIKDNFYIDLERKD